MKCETGPVSREFAGTAWKIYNGNDGASLVILTAQGNPASPFYFFLKADAGLYKIESEGNGEQRRVMPQVTKYLGFRLPSLRVFWPKQRWLREPHHDAWFLGVPVA
jgi:hypothetical protein